MRCPDCGAGCDGVPLRGGDLDFAVGLLRQHPRAGQKAGAGIAAIVVHRYVTGSRCFFVIRPDGGAVDFSVRKCLGQDPPRGTLLRQLMAAFDYAAVARCYRRLAGPGCAARRLVS